MAHESKQVHKEEMSAVNFRNECSSSTFGLLENADDIGRRRVSSLHNYSVGRCEEKL